MPKSKINDHRSKEVRKISYQVIRVEKFTKGSLVKIGAETERTAKNSRNKDIDETRTSNNIYFKKSDGGLNAEWKKIVAQTNASFKDTKKSVAFEGIIITSDKAFFESLGYIQGEQPPRKVLEFFERSYKFVLKEIGYYGTDENILSAVIHLDETTPHLQLYYVPIVDYGKKKIYAKGNDGKVLRNENGSPVQAKDINGKGKFEYKSLPQPKICSSDFWEQRGGQISFGNLQDDFYEQVALRYGLKRGEIGSNKKHTTKYEWEMQKLEEKKQNLTDALKPMEEYLKAFDDAIKGKKPFFKGQLEKQVVGLIAKYKLLEEEKKISEKDSEHLFNELKKYEQQISEIKKHEDFLTFLCKYAPDELEKTRKTAHERERLANKPTKNYFNYFSK